MESIIGCKPEFPGLNDLLLFGFLIYYFGFTLMAKSKEKLKLFPLLLLFLPNVPGYPCLCSLASKLSQ